MNKNLYCHMNALSAGSVLMAEDKVKRGWEFDARFVEEFDAWIAKSRLPKNAAAQLGLWLAMHLRPEILSGCLEAMSHDLPNVLLDLNLLSWDEDTLVRAFRRLDWEGKDRLLLAARLEVHNQEELQADLLAPTPEEAEKSGREKSEADQLRQKIQAAREAPPQKRAEGESA
jgi:hypothetical protein